MELITRKTAREIGSKTYFTGKPCKHGHISLKRTDSCCCVECGIATTAEWSKKSWEENYDDNLMRSRTYAKNMRANNPVSTLLSAARRRAKISGLEFNITHKDVQIPLYCPVIGIPLITNTKRQNANSPSIDRIDNTKGYIKGNVRVISWRINHRKSDMTIYEILALAEYINREVLLINPQ